jgi:hypothetical protein
VAEDEAVQLVGVVDREPLGDHRSHGGAVEVDLLDPELVEQRRHVVAPGLHRVVLVGPLGLAVPAQVEVEHPVSLRHQGRDRLEILVSETSAMNVHDDVTAPHQLIPEPDTVHDSGRHFSAESYA